MQQLLQIETVPIKMEVTSTRARFEKTDPMTVDYAVNSSAQAKESRVQSTTPAQGQISPVDAYESGVSASSYADMLAYETFGRDAVYTGSVVSSAFVDAGIKSAALTSRQEPAVSQSEFMQGVSKAYSTDRANFELNVGFGLTNFEFVPASIEFTVAQRPEVKIEYVGGPIYVPASADPNYVDITA